MKRIMSFCFVLLFLCSSAAAIEASFTKTSIECPSDFFLRNATKSTNGSLLLCGGIGKPMERVPQLLCVDTDGQMIWARQGDNYNYTNIYRDVKYIDDDTFIALRSAHKYIDGWIIECVRDGEVLWEREVLGNVYEILPLTDGILAAYKPALDSAAVMKLDLSGELLWQFDLAEPIMLRGVVSQNGIHVAYGNKTLPSVNDISSDPTSVVLALDDQGNLLWRHDSVGYEDFISAVWTDQGHIVLVGNAESDDRRYYTVIAEYNEKGLVWRTKHYFHNGGRVSWGYAEAILSAQGGYLVVTMPFSPNNSVQFLYYDLSGNQLNNWDISLGPLSIDSINPIQEANGDISLLIGGKIKPEDLDDDYLHYLLDSAVVLVEVHLKQ